MVFILDAGSNFDGPLDKIWKLNASEGEHPHHSLRNYAVQPQSETVLNFSYESTVARRNEKHKGRLTLMPPLGYSMEFLEGPFAGSRTYQYYIPQGKKTGVTVAGDWRSSSLSDDQLKKEVLKFLETVYNEDRENLKKLK